MATVDVDSQFSADSAQVDWLGLRVGVHPALSLHLSNEPGELSHCCHSYASGINKAAIVTDVARSVFSL